MNNELAKVRRAAVVAVIVADGRVLVIQRGHQVPGADYWAPPSGKVKADEDQATTVVREVKEEVGLTVRPLRLVWECGADGADYDLYWWLAVPADASLQMRLAVDEVAAAKWIRPEAFSQLGRTFPRGREFFRDILPTLPEWRDLAEGAEDVHS
ncbi:NUDIX hydrolase [Halomonas cerina]|uniref:8-oxo-dGTP pyrophosphatase MutT (NUDIX family) n=1 Tax=Halomonas cerina TaxID=447424 RepID=A0A839V7G3_9GAMM|nr:NUDIX hydrolase [Halomonas cerina]MBB3189910.1 8-oxo-dGTP pyrophosphatase MutT (NUDIX family) [Halomonas cerina]